MEALPAGGAHNWHIQLNAVLAELQALAAAGVVVLDVNDEAFSQLIQLAGSRTRDAIGSQLDTEGTPARNATDALYPSMDAAQPLLTGVLLGARELTALAGMGGATLVSVSPSTRYVPYWSMAKAYAAVNTLSQVGFASLKPPGWATKVALVRVHWFATTSAGSGTPRLRVTVGTQRTDGAADDDAPGLPVAGDQLPALPAVAYRRTVTEFGPGGAVWNVDPTKLVNVQVGRVGSSSTDNAAAVTIGITEVEVIWA